MVDAPQIPMSPVEQFKRRMQDLENESSAITAELSRQDLIGLCFRTQNVVRAAHSLLDRNQAALFLKDAQAVEDLYKYIGFAESHATKAMAEEFEFEKIKQRLYLATSLATYVARVMRKRAEEMLAQG